jgi:hypothetical protein
MDVDRVIEGVTDGLDEELDVWVCETDTEGLGEEEMGGDGDVILTILEK